MKRKSIILIIIITWLISMVGAVIGVNEYIKSKDSRLYREMYQNIRELFDGKQYADIVYSGKRVAFERISIPPQKATEQTIWQDYYGDLTKLYRIKWKKEEWSSKDAREGGWELVLLGYYDNTYNVGITKAKIFPYGVGYKRLDYSWEYNYVPSVSSAVKEAFKFFTTNPNSNFLNGTSDIIFERGSYNRILNKAISYSNEYYRLAWDSYPRISLGGGSPLFEEGERWEQHDALKLNYMHNGYYRVMIGQSQPQTLTIVKQSGAPDVKDKERLSIIWCVVLTIIMLFAVIPLSIKEAQSRKKREESLYDRLIRLCNPINYMKDYNRERVDKANSIYQRLLDTNPEDTVTLLALQSEAVSDLGVKMIESEDLENLLALVNPQKFMNPYNPDKVRLANELYSRLNAKGLTYEEYIDIEKKAKELEN